MEPSEITFQGVMKKLHFKGARVSNLLHIVGEIQYFEAPFDCGLIGESMERGSVRLSRGIIRLIRVEEVSGPG